MTLLVKIEACKVEGRDYHERDNWVDPDERNVHYGNERVKWKAKSGQI